MGKSLIITEKPSVARDIVAALGGFQVQGKQDYWESAEYVCTYAVGHLLELLEPEDIDPSYKAWRMGSLPIVPANFSLKLVKGQERRLKIIAGLAKRSDVRCLINACDAAREGELIFREIVSHLGCRKWVRRLWLQSMTPEAIRGGFASMRDGTDLEGLGQAAECRARADWLIGMNATRAFSLKLRGPEERSPWSVGRVQTPTLALLVERELAILNHVSRPYWRLVGTFEARDHTYEGVLFEPKFKADPARPEDKDDRYFDPKALARIAEAIKGQIGEASETREDSRRNAPYLFHLTGLQKYMGQRYKWTAKRTLEAAQRCYEQHKVLTYPRTSSTCLPSDYRGEVDRLLRGLAEHETYGLYAQTLLKDGLCNEGRTFNDKGVDDHFAIIPTGKTRALSGDDARLYDAVVRRFLATFFPPAVFDKVRRTTQVGEHFFRTGPVETLTVAGWMAVYEREAASNDKSAGAVAPKLPPLRAGRQAAQSVKVVVLGAQVQEESTRPPPRLTEPALLNLMERAGRQVEDEQVASALMSAEGLGTAATRADIIQNLKTKQYVDESLRPLIKGILLIKTLERIEARRLLSPELTGRLELELTEVEKNQRAAATFMRDVTAYVQEVVEKARGLVLEQAWSSTESLGRCPGCREGEVQERALHYVCAPVPGLRPSCGFRIDKVIHGRYVDEPLVRELLKAGELHDLEGFRDQSGRDCRVTMVVTSEGVQLRAGVTLADPVPIPGKGVGGRGASDSRRSGASAGGRWSRSGKNAGSGKGGATAVRSSGAASSPGVGRCPVHGEGCQVIETKGAYLCEKRLEAFRKGDTNLSGFWLPKILCQRPMTRDDVTTYLAAGVTPVLAGFVSKSGRPFQASLKLGADGSFTFQFPDRPSDRPSDRVGRAGGSKDAADQRITH